MMRSGLCCAALAAAIFTSVADAAPLHHRAEATEAAAAIRVQFRDLDLARPTGVRALNDRVRRAARKVCTDQLRMALPLERSACVKSAIRDSRRQVDVAVTAFGASRLADGGMIEVAVRSG